MDGLLSHPKIVKREADAPFWGSVGMVKREWSMVSETEYKSRNLSLKLCREPNSGPNPAAGRKGYTEKLLGWKL